MVFDTSATRPRRSIIIPLICRSLVCRCLDLTGRSRTVSRPRRRRTVVSLTPNSTASSAAARRALDVGPLLGRGGGVGVQANAHQGFRRNATIRSSRNCRDSYLSSSISDHVH